MGHLEWAREGGVGPVHGFSLLNDSKYGYDAKDNVLAPVVAALADLARS